MASGSISEASSPPLSRESTKKKKTNGSAKLKQIKLDVRREQWLSRVKKGCTVESNERVDFCPPGKHIASEENGSSMKANRREREEDGEVSCIQQDSNLGSMMNNIHIQSAFDHHELGNGLSGRSSSSSITTSTCFSGNVSGEEEDDDGCLDDWEAVADALNADDNLHTTVSDSHAVPEASVNPSVEVSKNEFNCRAWKADDALRPRCLPNLSKQHISPFNSGCWHGNRKTVPWHWQTIISQPSQCPICYEDLDMTDSSFLPCSCGFSLCLFCHKKILEADGRCPGCRKLYDLHVDGNVGLSIGAEVFIISQ